MISKLESIKEKLEYTLSVLSYADIRGANASLQGARKDVITSLNELNEVMERINSEELVKEVAIELKSWQTEIPRKSSWRYLRADAQAVINIIRGKDDR